VLMVILVTVRIVGLFVCLFFLYLSVFVSICVCVCQNADGYSAVHGAVQRTSNCSILCVPGAVCGSVVHG